VLGVARIDVRLRQGRCERSEEAEHDKLVPGEGIHGCVDDAAIHRIPQGPTNPERGWKLHEVRED
jgi:hypothetical protein